MKQHGKNKLLILLGCIVIACGGIERVAMAAGGDIDWFEPVSAGSVAYQGGKIYSSGLDFTNGLEVLVACRRAGDGQLLWEERIGADRIGPFVWFEPQQIAANGRNVAVAGNIDRGTGPDWAVIIIDTRNPSDLKLTEVPFEGSLIGNANSVAIADQYVITTGTEITNFFGGFPYAFFVTRGFSVKTGELLWTDIDPREGTSFGDKVVILGGDDDDSDSDSDEGLYEDDDDDEGQLAIAYGMIAHVDDPNDPADDGDFFDKLIRAYNPRTGDIVWSQTIDSGRMDAGTDAFDVHNGKAYFAFTSFSIDPFVDGTWQAGSLDARTGAPLWTVEYGEGNVDGLAVKGNQLAVAVNCGIQKIQAHTGAALWMSRPENACALNPVISQGRIIAAGFTFSPPDGFPPWLLFENVTAFKTQNGAQAWTVDVPFVFHPLTWVYNQSDVIVAGRDKVFVGGFDQLSAFDVR